MTESQMNAVCKILNIEQSNSNDVEIINLLFDMFEDAVCLRVGVAEVPKILEWIVNEVVIKRFQLIGAEHLESEGIDVLSSTYKNVASLLLEYDSYFNDYLAIYGENDNVQKRKNKCRLL